MATRSLNVQITGDAKGLGVAAHQADGHMDGLGKSATRMGKVMALGFATAGAAAAGALAVGLKKSVDAAKDAEASQARMVTQLKASGLSYRAHAKEIDNVIQKTSRLAALDDEDLQDAFTNIVRVTGDVDKSMRLVGLAADFARAKHMDVAKAGELVGKVAGGNTGILSRYGIKIKEGASATEALGILQQKFAGQAEAYGKTAAGAQERFGVAVENLQEKIGMKLLPVVTDITLKVSKFVEQMESGRGAGGRFADRVSEGFAKVKAVAEAVWPVLRDGGKVALGLLQTGFGRLKSVIEAVAPTFERVKALVIQLAPVVARLATDGFRRVTSAAGTVQGAVVTAFGAVKGAVSTAVQFVSKWIDKHRDDLDAFLHAWKNIGTGVAVAVGAMVAVVKLQIEKVLIPVMKVVLSVVRTVWPSIKKVIEGALQAIGGLVQVFSGIFTGDFKRVWEGVKDIFRGNVKVVLGIVVGLVKGVPKALAGLGGIIKDAVVDAIKAAARAIPGLVAGALKGLGKAVTDLIKKGFGALNPFGDGIGKPSGDGLGFLPSGGGGNNALMGADSDLFPIVQTAGRFGLHTSSGLRPGSTTRNGNISFHSSGDAVDEAGSPGNMLRFFNFMKNTAGSRLRELIYTPGGVGIKDGRPFRYTGQVAADHYDHVHVAYTGPFGDGLGKFDATSYGPPWGGIQGTGVTATGVNLKGNPHTYGVAVDPRVIPLGSKLKISPNPFGYGGTFTAFDTGGAIKGKRIDFYDWRGRAQQNGWGHRNVSVELVTGSGGLSKGSNATRTVSNTAKGADGVPREQPAPTTRLVTLSDGRRVRLPIADDGSGLGRPNAGDIKGLPEDSRLPDPGAAPTEYDHLAGALARAEVSGDSKAILDATQAIANLRYREYQAAVGTADPRDDVEAAGNYRSAQDALVALTDALKANTDAIEEQRKQYETLIAEDYRNKYNVSQSQYQILAQAVSDAANGGIGQRLGLGLSGLRAPAGSVARI